MALVHEHYEILVEIIDERIRRLARFSPVEIPRIIFYPATIAHFSDHFYVVIDALAYPLRFYELIRGGEFRFARFHIEMYFLKCTFELIGAYHVVGRGVDSDVLNVIYRLARNRVELRDALHFVAEKGHSYSHRRRARGEYLQAVAARAESAAHEVYIASFILYLDELVDDIVAFAGIPFAYRHDVLEILSRRAEPVYAGNGSHDYHVRTLAKRGSRRMAQFIYLVVDFDLLLYIGVGSGDIRFGLIIIVIADEIFDAVMREKLPEFVTKLRGEGFVVRDDERGLAAPRYHVCHRKSLARTGHAEQYLRAFPFLDTLNEGVYSLLLVAARGIRRSQFIRYFFFHYAIIAEIITFIKYPSNAKAIVRATR